MRKRQDLLPVGPKVAHSHVLKGLQHHIFQRIDVRHVDHREGDRTTGMRIQTHHHSHRVVLDFVSTDAVGVVQIGGNQQSA
jgi:hypothetical protein